MASLIKFDGDSKLTDVVKALGYELRNLFNGRADLYKDGVAVKLKVSQENLWYYLIKKYPDRFAVSTKVK